MSLSINDFFTELDQFTDQVPLDTLVDLLKSVDISIDDVCDHHNYCDDNYERNLWRCNTGYAALILCWKPGQASPIHDHGGSSCAFRIVHGVGSESVFTLDANRLRPLEERTHATGTVTSSRDEEIHELVNRQAFDLVTIHLYSPALDRLRTYGHVPRTESKAAA